MNTKKKILSFALACLVIVMTFSAIIPVSAATITNIACDIKQNEKVVSSHTSLSAAISAAVSGDTIVLKNSGHVDYLSSTQYNIMFNSTTSANLVGGGSLTIESQDSDNPVTVTMINGGIVVNKLCNITFKSINFVQDNESVTGNTQSIVSPRRGATVTFNNCSFEFNGDRGDGNPYFWAMTGNGGTVKMDNCKINMTDAAANTTSPMFASSGDNFIFNIDLNDVEITTKTDIPMFRLCSKMNVIISGNTTFKGVTNVFTKANAEDYKGGTVNILNGRTYGSYTAPELMDGASIRISEQGLRFTIADVSKLGATYGMLFAKDSDTWNNTTFVLDAEKTVSASADGTGLNDTSYNMVLTGATLDQDYAARAYAQYTDCGGATITVYSAFDASKNVRSMKGIASYIVEQGTASYCDDVAKTYLGEN